MGTCFVIHVVYIYNYTPSYVSRPLCIAVVIVYEIVICENN